MAEELVPDPGGVFNYADGDEPDSVEEAGQEEKAKNPDSHATPAEAEHGADSSKE